MLHVLLIPVEVLLVLKDCLSLDMQLVLEVENGQEHGRPYCNKSSSSRGRNSKIKGDLSSSCTTSRGLFSIKCFIGGKLSLKLTIHIIIIIYEVGETSDGGFILGWSGKYRMTMMVKPKLALINCSEKLHIGASNYSNMP